VAELFASGHVVDLIIAFMVVEAVVLLAWRRRTGHGIAPGPLVASLLAGFFLLLALRSALTGAPWAVMAGWLLAALVAHLADLIRRLTRR
jgi:hypothetical protein